MPKQVKQRRVLLQDEYAYIADEICKQAGIHNCSQLLSLFLLHFGDELVKRLEGQKETNNG